MTWFDVNTWRLHKFSYAGFRNSNIYSNSLSFCISNAAETPLKASTVSGFSWRQLHNKRLNERRIFCHFEFLFIIHYLFSIPMLKLLPTTSMNSCKKYRKVFRIIESTFFPSRERLPIAALLIYSISTIKWSSYHRRFLRHWMFVHVKKRRSCGRSLQISSVDKSFWRAYGKWKGKGKKGELCESSFSHLLLVTFFSFSLLSGCSKYEIIKIICHMSSDFSRIVFSSCFLIRARFARVFWHFAISLQS